MQRVKFLACFSSNLGGELITVTPWKRGGLSKPRVALVCASNSIFHSLENFSKEFSKSDASRSSPLSNEKEQEEEEEEEKKEKWKES